MESSNSRSSSIARHVRTLLHNRTGARPSISGPEVRSAAVLVTRAALTVGLGAAGIARASVEGTVRAATEIGGETTLIVRDAVIGVIEGTEQVVTITTPAVREVVAGAIRSSGRTGEGAVEVSETAVEGAMIGASSVGLDTTEAAAAAAEAALEAVEEAGGELGEAATATMGGVMSGVAASGGDVISAVRTSAAVVVERAASAEAHREVDVAEVAGEVLGKVIGEAERSTSSPEEAMELVTAAAEASVNAAYLVSRSHGDQVREEVVRTVSRERSNLAPELRRQLAALAASLPDRLPRGRTAWRAQAMARAARFTADAGAVDQAASLAYFTVLSFFPLVALSIIVFSLFADPETIRVVLEELVTHYLPASSGLFHESVGSLLGNAAAFGALATGSLLLSANGLFMAANRSINRVMGADQPRSLRGRIVESLVTGVLGLSLMLSIGLSIFVQISLGEGGGHLQPIMGSSLAWQIVLGAASALLPPIVTGLAFTVIYRNLSHINVEWRDAAFGGMITVFLFEIGKHLFFWLAGIAAQRSIVYGPVASAVLLLMWAFTAGLIFLYGAGLVRAAGELRPGPVTPSRKRKNVICEEESRE